MGFRDAISRLTRVFRPKPGVVLTPHDSLLSHPELLPPGFSHGVEILNDDTTPMQFVVNALRTHVGLSETDAISAMLEIHSKGRKLFPAGTLQLAQTMAAAISADARERGYPLVCRAVNRGSPPSSAARDPANYAMAEVYTKLRSQALGAAAKTLGSKEQTFGVIMETGYPEAVVTLVALADGTASLYFSSGGGMIGLGQHERPAVAARSLISFADHNLKQLTPAADTPMPRPGHTRFYVLTQRGTLTAEAEEMELGENRHVLSPLFYSAQELITEMRNVEESRK